MAGLQQQAAKAILDDPAVDTLSSFIGVDGANNSMLHTGQMLINLKADRGGSQEKIMQRLRDSRRRRAGRHPVSPAHPGPDDRRRDRPDLSTACRWKAPTPPWSRNGPASWPSAWPR
jgi:hypothetical protein